MNPLLKHVAKHPMNDAMSSLFASTIMSPTIMSPTIMTVAVVGLLCAMLCAGCGDDDNGSNAILAPQSGAIEGTWDLARVTSEWDGQVYDYTVSATELTFEFDVEDEGEVYHISHIFERQ